MYRFSATTGGFYHADWHGDAIPADAVDVSAEEHAALLAGQAIGQRIVAGPDGQPVLVASYDIALHRAELRAARAAALAASDWTQLADVPAAIRKEWAPYRQALRDFGAAIDAADDWQALEALALPAGPDKGGVTTVSEVS